MDGIFIFGTPATSVIALGSEQFHIYRLSEGLANRGWNLNPLQFPSGIHLCVTQVHTQPGVADEFLKDVREILAEILKNPGVQVEGMVSAGYHIFHFFFKSVRIRESISQMY